jgi:hypothetical protein
MRAGASKPVASLDDPRLSKSERICQKLALQFSCFLRPDSFESLHPELDTTLRLVTIAKGARTVAREAYCGTQAVLF